MRPAPAVQCREIESADLESVIDLLTIGFQHSRNRSYWANAINRLSKHPTPDGYPRFGYLLESNKSPVGVLLAIFSARCIGGSEYVRCNGSSLYIEPPFRCYAPLLVRRVERYRNVTYLNVTPDEHTWPAVEAQGYKRLSDGQFICVPLLRKRRAGDKIRVRTVDPKTCQYDGLQPLEAELLAAHSGYGCVCLICECGDGVHPFVFGLRKKYGIPLAQLIYCRDQKDFVWLAPYIGRYLLRRGIPLTVLDADGPVPGLAGHYVGRGRRYWRGPEPQRVGDLSYTEVAMFGY
jgi:hypothetical protein